MSLSSLLTERGIKRLEKFKEIKSLYNLRSKIVHGSDIKETEADTVLSGSFNLLSELISYMIENNRIVDETDFRDAIFN